MKKLLFCLSLLSVTSAATAQNELTGNLNIPSLQSVSVLYSDDRAIDFSTIQDYAEGKIIPSYCRIIVKSNHPWRLSGYINTNFADANNIADGIISLQLAGTNTYIPLSGKPTDLLVSTNNNISNEYTFNLKIDPKLKLNTKVLLMGLSFRITER